MPLEESDENRKLLESAQGYDEVWQLAKANVRTVLDKGRGSMMLFLDDMPLRLGAYHPMGTNNIVLNRALIQIVEATTKSGKLLNAFVYVLLLHEYLHALGYLRETHVRPLVYRVSKECFGEEYITTQLAKLGPWTLLHGLPLDRLQGPKRVIEIVKDFEKANLRYIA